MKTFNLQSILKELFWLGFILIILLIRHEISNVWGFMPIGFYEGFEIFINMFFRVIVGAFPFLLMGTVAAAIFELVAKDFDVPEAIKNSGFFSALVGVGLGFCIPIGHSGSVPFTERLAEKGWPVATVVTYFLSVPLINPVGLASMYVLTSNSTLFIPVITMTLIVAVVSGFVISSATESHLDIFNNFETNASNGLEKHNSKSEPGEKNNILHDAALMSVDILFQYGKLFIVGAIITALIWVFLSTLEASPGILQKLVFPFLVGNETARISVFELELTDLYSPGVVLSSIILGGMLNIQRIVMASHFFRKQAIAVLIIIPTSITILVNFLWTVIAQRNV